LTLWCSGLSDRAQECHKLKIVGYTSMTKGKALTGLAVKGLMNIKALQSALLVFSNVRVAHMA